MVKQEKSAASALDDTIAAISTPLGEGGIGVVRLSGKQAIAIADKMFKGEKSLSQVPSHQVSYGEIVDSRTGEVLDEVLATVFRSPRSYTAEDLVEISCHGGQLVVSRVLEQAMKCGARLAEPGEFTLRAFINGRMDLSQAEAVAEVIRAKTDLGLKLALEHLKGGLSQKINSYGDRLIDILARLEVEIDFSEEEVEPIDRDKLAGEIDFVEKEIDRLLATYNEGRILKDGLNVVIVGKTNVGKSSLLNALLQADRAIVTPIPGTTRDTISEFANFRGIPVRLVDTAGYRISRDMIELEGIKRTKIETDAADLLLVMFDTSTEIDDEDVELLNQIRDRARLLVLNKTDITPPDVMRKNEEKIRRAPIGDRLLKVSALRGDGLEELKEVVASASKLAARDRSEGVMLSSIRHRDALARAEKSLSLAKESLQRKMSAEFVALDVKAALDAVGEVVGKTVTDDILNKIFSEFCVGK
jgi:tRNA modification GTPase